MIKPEIKIIPEKKLVGKSLVMSFSEYRISELWKKFMPVRNEIPNRVNNELISVSIYEDRFLVTFDPTRKFIKWATAEVKKAVEIPEDMETMVLHEGLYAVFHYKGLSTDNSIYQYIFNVWLPASDYVLDDLPHFEVLGEKYKNNDPGSEEDIYIPVRLK